MYVLTHRLWLAIREADTEGIELLSALAYMLIGAHLRAPVVFLIGGGALFGVVIGEAGVRLMAMLATLAISAYISALLYQQNPTGGGWIWSGTYTLSCFWVCARLGYVLLRRRLGP